MPSVATIEWNGWNRPTPMANDQAAATLEAGDVLILPSLAFEITNVDRPLLSPTILSSSKNASFDHTSGRVGGTTLTGAERDRLRHFMQRFSNAAASLIADLFPHYQTRLERARTSFRPAEIAGRPTSWRHDDTRLHVDAFPATPSQGRRILRVFTNVNPDGRARSWKMGEDFESIAVRFANRLSFPWPGSARLLRSLHITKALRTPYDTLMLQLHDRMKADLVYQRTSPQTAVEFPAGSTWVAFTDQVSHAVTAGQFQLEQTFYLPVNGMIDEQRSPLRVLERVVQRRLV